MPLASEAEGGVDNPTASIDARVDVLEPMGENIFVYLEVEESGSTDNERRSDWESSQLLMNVEPDLDIEVGDRISITLDRDNVHLFDSASGEAIRHDINSSQAMNEVLVEDE